MRRELINEAFASGVDPDKIQGCDDEDMLSGFIAERKARKREEDRAKEDVIPETEDEARKALEAQNKKIVELTSELSESTLALKALLES